MLRVHSGTLAQTTYLWPDADVIGLLRRRAASGLRLAAILERRVTAMQHQRIPIGVAERSHLTDASVERVAVELHASGFELGSRGSNIRNPQRKPGWASGERPTNARRVEDIERYLACTELYVVLTLALDFHPEQLRVETLRASDVRRQERHEINMLYTDGHHRRA